jgi:FG-GAP-like repeat/HYR domain
VAGSQPHGVAIGDLDGDHNADLVVGNRVSDSISVLLGDGSGTFGHPNDFPGGDGPFGLALGDLDHDGDLDVAVAAFDADQVVVLRGDGTGSLGAPDLYSAKNGPQGVALGELKEDGHTDIAAANFFADLASVFLGDGTGIFSPQSSFGAGDGPKSVAIGDLDGDGHNDLAIAASESDTVSVLAGDGAGGFAVVQSFAAGDNPSSITIAELNGAGLPDLLVADRFGEVVSALLNQGSPPPADTTAPTLTLPGTVVVNATKPSGAVVGYTASATDDQDPSPSVSCAPASGSTFAIGTTAVNCTATDDADNSSTGSFNVVVRGAPEQLVDLIDRTLALRGLGPVHAGLRNHLQSAFACLIQRNRYAACRGLDFYIYVVRVAGGVRWITSAQANSLAADAQRIKNVIGC